MHFACFVDVGCADKRLDIDTTGTRKPKDCREPIQICWTELTGLSDAYCVPAVRGWEGFKW
jgi:hypothetical protein